MAAMGFVYEWGLVEPVRVMNRSWGKDGGFLEREDPLLGLSGVYGTDVFRVHCLSTPGAALLGDCGHSVQEDTQFRVGMSGLQSFQTVRPLR